MSCDVSGVGHEMNVHVSGTHIGVLEQVGWPRAADEHQRHGLIWTAGHVGIAGWRGKIHTTRQAAENENDTSSAPAICT